MPLLRPRVPHLAVLLFPATAAAAIQTAEEPGKVFGNPGEVLRVTVREDVLGYRDPQMSSETWLLSPDGRSLAYLVSSGGELHVVHDGVEGPGFDGIAAESLVFSPDSKRLAYVATDEGKRYVVVDGTAHEALAVHASGVVFGPSSRRVAWCVALPTGETQVVVDGEPIGAWGGVDARGLVFSPDGAHHAFVANRAGGQVVVHDGVEGPQLEEVLEFWWSPVGSHLCYAALSNGRTVLFVDGEVVADADAIGREGFVFPRAADRWAIPVRRGDAWSLLVDGRLEGEYRNLLPSVRFSEDGENLAYLAGRGEGMFLVLNGEEQAGRVYESLQFEGPRTAFVVNEEGGQRVVLDGVEHELFDRIEAPGVVFSAGGAHAFYVGRRGEDAFVVLDGRVGPPVRRFGDPPVFHGQRLAYTIRSKGSEVLVLDGQPGEPETRIRHLALGPDGQRVAYFAGEGELWTLVVDGERSGRFHRVTSPPLFSPDGRRVAHVAGIDRRIHVVLDGEAGPPFDYVPGHTLAFTTDGGHLGYLAARGERRYVVVDEVVIDNGYDGFHAEDGVVAVDESTLYVRAARQGVWLFVELALAP